MPIRWLYVSVYKPEMLGFLNQMGPDGRKYITATEFCEHHAVVWSNKLLVRGQHMCSCMYRSVQCQFKVSFRHIVQRLVD